MSIALSLSRVHERMRKACARAGRTEDSVRLLAVTKGHDADAIRTAYAAGQREFGENYVQELVGKARALADLPDLRLRFIGRLQRNKAKDIAALGCAVDTVASLSIAQVLNDRALAQATKLSVLLQVNVDREPQKAGVLPEEAPALVQSVRALPGLSLEGLMTIPRAGEHPEQVRPAFASLRELARTLGLHEVSMGMSDDLEVAIEEGATIVRVGTAIFGPRG